MAHDNHTELDDHRELQALGRKKLLATVAGWVDPYPPPPVETFTLAGGRRIRVVRDDKVGLGTKIRAASAVLSQPEYRSQKTIVYVAPRAGWAPISLAKICAETGRRLVLFCPAAATISDHQRCAYELGAELRFIRIAAMPVLQGAAKKWADQHGYAFFPLGLAVPAAVAAVAKVAMGLKLRDVSQVWSVISTGVLSRGLQVAWPDADHQVVAVARNIHDGEKGIATIHSHPKPFLQNVQLAERPPFDSAVNYDAAAWRFIMSLAEDNAVFWNVAGNVEPTFQKAPPVSQRAWNDNEDLRRA